MKEAEETVNGTEDKINKVKIRKGWAVLILHAAVSFMRMETQHFQCADEGGRRTGEVRTHVGGGVQEDEQRGKGRRKG